MNMRKFIVIGDTHDFDVLRKITKHHLGFCISVGDNGIGFDKYDNYDLPRNILFISGNHDNPNVCNRLPGYLGRYGIAKVNGVNVLYISGAKSPDANERTIGVDWWLNEELSYRESNELLEMLLDSNQFKIDVVITHDCPSSISGFQSYTGYLLNEVQKILESKAYQTTWVFGHHHKSTTQVVNNITFIGLSICEIYNYYGDN